MMNGPFDDATFSNREIGTGFTVSLSHHSEKTTPDAQNCEIKSETLDTRGTAQFTPFGRLDNPAGDPDKALSEAARDVLKKYSKDVKRVALGFAAVGGFMSVLAGVPEPVVTKATVALWGLGTVALGIASVVIEDLAEDPPDPDYTTFPQVIRPSARTVPTPRPTRQFARLAARRMRSLVSLEVRKAGLATAILQGVERAGAARLAGATDWEARQLSLARARAGTLAALLRQSSRKRAELARAWRSAELPNPRLTRADARRFLASARGLRAKLLRLGFPKRMVRAAIADATGADIEPASRPLLAQITARALRRSEVRAASAFESFSTGCTTCSG